MKFFQLINGVMMNVEGAYPYQTQTEWAPRGEVEHHLIQHAEHFYGELKQVKAERDRLLELVMALEEIEEDADYGSVRDDLFKDILRKARVALAKVKKS